MKEKLYNCRHTVFFGVFLFLHTLTCFFTTYFGDDYYYAAFLKNGPEYMLSENILHYMQTNGRALVHIIDELLLGVSFNLWRVSSILVMAVLGVILAKLASRQYRKDADREEYKNALIIVLSLLSFTDIAILRQSFYWATGALNYLFPATLTLLYVYLARKALENERGFYPLIPLALIGAATTEQASAALLIATVWVAFTALITKKKHLILPTLTNFAAAAAGISTLLFAPGNAVRTTYYPDFYALSPLERILRNDSELISVIFGNGGISALITAAILIVIFKFLKKAPFISILSALSLGVYIYCTVTGTNLLAFALILIPLAAAMIHTLFDYFRNKEADNIYFIWSAVAVQCAMLLSPEFGPRTLTTSLLLLIVPVARTLLEMKSVKIYALLAGIGMLYQLRSFDNFTPFVILAVLSAVLAFVLKKHFAFRLVPTIAAFLALIQFATVPMGYAKNLSTHELNRCQIESYDAASGEPLTLYYLPNTVHKYTMPYDDPYHEYMLIRLCDLPEDTEVVYEWQE